ncbi:MAG: T9SS type A sorting domain-containing protein [Chlorobi bacterium]|nr:T9SS type A sorting domain-containing protein [Chlorobiota bacterium]
MKFQKLLYLPVLMLFMCCTSGISVAQTDLTPYQGNPVLDFGSPGSWDAGWVAFGRTVLYNGVYYSFYAGSPDLMTSPEAIGYATSSDGILFTKYENNPVLKGDSSGFDAYFVSEPVPLIEDSIWILYYNASPAPSGEPGPAIGRATASDPSGPWTRGDSAVLETGNAGEWDASFIMPNSVIHTDSGYVMYYSASIGPPSQGAPAMIGMATSADGITWTKYDDPATTDPPYADSDPVLTLGSPGSWDAGFAWECTVWQTTNGWEMYYSGTPDNFATEQIGYATSTDGINWVKYENNPILSPDESWANLWLLASSVVIFDSTYYLYYTGFDGFTSARVGLATTPLTGLNEHPDQPAVPSDYSMYQNFPNPFKTSTTIRFSVPESGWVTLRVFDFQGNEVATIVSGELTSGTYQYQLDANDLAAGVYFYQLQAGNFRQTKKLVLLK